MPPILAGENRAVLRYLLIAVGLLALYTHWRAAYTGEVRTALAALPAGEEHFDDLLHDVRDRRLFHQCRAVLADQKAGRRELFEEHRTAALARVEHLERYAPLRRLASR
jgi:hypothetical protein